MLRGNGTSGLPPPTWQREVGGDRDRAGPMETASPVPHRSSPEHLAQVGARSWGGCGDIAQFIHVRSNALIQEGLQTRKQFVAELWTCQPRARQRGRTQHRAAPSAQADPSLATTRTWAVCTWYLKGLCCSCHHLQVWGQEAIHGGREETGQVSPAQVLLQSGEGTEEW